MKAAKIITLTEPSLREKSKKVEVIDKRILNLVKELENTLQVQKNPKGVGIAAPQIGQNLRICLIHSQKSRKFLTLINPEIVWGSKRMTDNKAKARTPLEGCLSVPGFWGPVKRHKIIKIKYQTPNGQEITRKFDGFTAIVAQHEIDHLDGILFIDRIRSQKGKLYQAERNKKGEEELVEVKFG